MRSKYPQKWVHIHGLPVSSVTTRRHDAHTQYTATHVDVQINYQVFEQVSDGDKFFMVVSSHIFILTSSLLNAAVKALFTTQYSTSLYKQAV
jgi:predicted glycosyltransferase involved in capsule biosynthesis